MTDPVPGEGADAWSDQGDAWASPPDDAWSDRSDDGPDEESLEPDRRARPPTWTESYARRVLLAVLLGLASIPLAAASIAGFATDATGQPVSLPPVDAVVMALVACLAASVVGGAVAALVVLRHPSAAIWLAIAIAWPVAIATIPLTPRLLGIDYYGGFLCFDTCDAMVDSHHLSATILGYALTVVLPIVVTGIGALIALAVGWRARRSGRQAVSAIAAGTSIVILNLWTVALASAAALALVVGVGIWTYVLRRRPREDPDVRADTWRQGA